MVYFRQNYHFDSYILGIFNLVNTFSQQSIWFPYFAVTFKMIVKKM